MLSTAKNIEKLRKIPAAVETYGRIVTEFAGTDQVREADAMIKALGGE